MAEDKIAALEAENGRLRQMIVDLEKKIATMESEKQAALLKMEMETDQKVAKLTTLMTGSQKKGWLYKEKHGLKNMAIPWHKRFFILKENILAWYRDETASSKPSGHISVETYRVYKIEEKDAKKQFCFELVDQRDNKIRLAAESEDECKAWMEALKNAKNRKFAQKKIIPQEDDDDVTFSDAPSGQGNEDDNKSIIKEGWLEKKGQTRRNWNKRYFVLRGTTLSYYTDTDRAILKGRVTLVGARILTHAVKHGDEKPLIFAIRGADRDFIMRAADLDEKDAWVRVLKENLVAH